MKTLIECIVAFLVACFVAAFVWPLLSNSGTVGKILGGIALIGGCNLSVMLVRHLMDDENKDDS